MEGERDMQSNGERERERVTGIASVSGTVAVQMTCRWGWCTMFYEEVAPGC